MEHIVTPPAGSPADLGWLIPLLPAVSAAVLLLFGKRLGARWAAGIGVGVVALTAVLSTAVFVQLLGQDETARVLVREVTTWINAGTLQVDWALLFDPLSAMMLLLVTWVGLLIHIYSVGYMHGDERQPRFFAYLNLFIASMLVLVLGESLLTLFVGWELVGLCSYLLIGFWFERRDFAVAAKKAFVVNRVGDVGFMVAMFVVFGAFGTLSLAEVLPNADTLSSGAAVAVGLLLLLGAAGKSAQIPLYVWLPDAMAGPTPVSALIHAATMVTGGVYLIARTSPIYLTVPDVGLVVAWIGVVTALLAALIACAQRDLKRILAYSTVSQLGFMFVAVGVGAHVAGVFHLLTHGFFKALLFLAAGSVMHAMADETDVWRMGGLLRHLPVTGVTAAIGVLAIAGIPPLSGFFSKELILTASVDRAGAGPVAVLAIVAAALTAFYMGRWFVLIFLGRPRWSGDLHPHESPPSMTVPLVLLAVGSVLSGLLNWDVRSFPSPHEGWLADWLAPSVVEFFADAPLLDHTLLAVLAIAVAVLGLAGAALVYLRRAPATEPLAAPLGGFWRAASEAFSVDELYDTVIVRPGRAVGDAAVWFDRVVIDGAVNGLARLTGLLATVGRRVQTGYVRSYALAVLAGTVLVAALLFGPMR